MKMYLFLFVLVSMITFEQSYAAKCFRTVVHIDECDSVFGNKVYWYCGKDINKSGFTTCYDCSSGVGGELGRLHCTGWNTSDGPGPQDDDVEDRKVVYGKCEEPRNEELCANAIEIFHSNTGNNNKGSRCYLDANGGREKPYMHKKLGDNDNFKYYLRIQNPLWKYTNNQETDIVPIVNKSVALDANGGRDNPYFNDDKRPNDNLIFEFFKTENWDKGGNCFFIKPKGKDVVLDANNCQGKPYFHGTPDMDNVNHVWCANPTGKGVFEIFSLKIVQ